MTCNNIILSQPDAGATINHQIPDDVSARLNFGPEDIQGLRLGSEGGLVISFVDGGQLNISNFEDLIDNGNLLYLEDGTMIDPSILTASLSSPQDFGQPVDLAAININQPAANTTQEIALQAGQKYVCDFDPKNAATVEVLDGRMVLTFADGSQVVINNFSEVMAGELPAELTVADGTIIDSEELLTAIDEIETIEEVLEVAAQPAVRVANIEPAAGENPVAETLANIEPAAGESAPGNSGFGFNSSPTAAPFDAPDAIGPLGPTALQFGAPDPALENLLIVDPVLPPLPAALDLRPVFGVNEVEIDETNIDGVGVSVSGTVDVDYGTDGPGRVFIEDNGNEIFVSCGNNGNFETVTSNGVVVVINQDIPNDTVTGTVNGQTAFVFEILDGSTGDFRFTQFLPLDHDDPTQPDEPLCLGFSVAARDGDGDFASTLVNILIHDDAPVVGDDTNNIDETDLSAGNIVINDSVDIDFGEDGQGTLVTNDTFVSSGSRENNQLSSDGVAVVVAENATNTGYVGTANGVTVFTLDIDPNTGDYTFTLIENLDHADGGDINDVITLDFGIVITDFDGDSDPGTITINIADDAPVFQPAGPQVNNGQETVDETDLGPTIVTGTLIATSNEGDVSFAPVDNFTADGSLLANNLSHCNEDITVTLAGDTYTGTTAGGDVAFTLVIDAITGDYTFTQNLSLDHADGNDANDVINLNFPVNAVDVDGDATLGLITVSVLDDAPVATNATSNVDETNGAATTVSDTLVVDFGVDSAATVDAINSNGNFTSAGSRSNGALTSGGVAVDVAQDGAGYIGTANGQTVFTLTIDPVTGDYTYNQVLPLDHADGNDADDIINLTFGVDVTDKDGDSVESTIVINVADDAPVRVVDIARIDETDLENGPIVVNDNIAANFGFDGSGTLSINDFFSPAGNVDTGVLRSGGVEVQVDPNATDTGYVGTANGQVVFTLDIDLVTGDYTFTQNLPLDHSRTDLENEGIFLRFGVVSTDADGDRSNNIINVAVRDDAPARVIEVGRVDETDLENGPIVLNDTVDVDFGVDGAGSITASGTFTATSDVATGVLRSGGVEVQVDPNATNTGYVGTANGQVVFTLEIDSPSGDYTFTQNLPLDHANTNAVNEAIVLRFGTNVTDSDGDVRDDGQIAILVRDDAPARVIEIGRIDETDLENGPIVLNDTVDVDFGVDGVGSITASGTFTTTGNVDTGDLRSNGVEVQVDPNATNTGYVGTANGQVVFTLEIDSPSGDYTFTQNLPLDHSRTDLLNEAIVLRFGTNVTDSDGDVRDDGQIAILVRDDGPFAVNDVIAVQENEVFIDNVLGNDNLSVDLNNIVTQVVFDGVVTAVPAAGTVDVIGDNGTLVISANGDYTYTPNNNNPNGRDLFTYTLQDGDGDTNTAVLNIRVTPDFAPIQIAGSGETDDTELANGPDVEAGGINVNYRGDGPGTTAANGSFSVAGNLPNGQFTHNGVEIITTPNGNTYTGIAGGVVVFTMVINANETFEFTQFENIDHANTNQDDESTVLRFGVTATDADGDTGDGIVTIRVRDDAPIESNDVQTVDETNLSGGAITVSDSLGANLGQDDQGSVITNNTFSAEDFLDNGVLSSDGDLITVNATPNSYIGTTADGTVIFSLVIDENTGDYTFTQNRQLDHSDVNDQDEFITLRFGVVTTDGDGDSVEDQISVVVRDDGPQIVNGGDRTIDETDLQAAPVEAFGQVIVDFGVDVPGTIDPNGDFVASNFLDNGILSHDGSLIDVNVNGDTYVGTTAAGDTAFTLFIDQATGEYTFTQFLSLDHADDTAANETIIMTFGVVATDSDGDAVETEIIIRIQDDAPIAVDDVDTVARTGTTATGNVLANDNIGVDDLNAAQPITPQTINGQFGQLVLAADGSYVYTRTDLVGGGTERFNYTITDSDDDADLGQLVINVAANAPAPPPQNQPREGGDGGFGGAGPDPDCPLVIDLDGDGIELISKSNGVQFDINNDGIKDQTAWVSADDGILVRDINEDGIINDHSEMFGNDEIGGFEMLAQSDDNNDGVIDAQDAIWSTLKIWQDQNGDAFSQADEFITFDQLGIEAISLSTTLVGEIIEGNYVGESGEFITEDGENYEGYDAWFQYDRGTGESDTVLEATAERDTFIFEAIRESAVEIKDFDPSQDVIDLSALIEGDDDVSNAIDEFVAVDEQDGATIISIDVDGSEGPADAVEIAKLENVTGLSLEDMFNAGNIAA